ncbi:MAG: alpha/beta fold hydrolase, partial [Bacilli bacterium]|nr:alpha/beta fold hydrolase [Bacilli bacterium]
MYKDIKREYNINIKEMLPENPKEIMVAIHGFAGDKESSAISMVAEELMKQDIGVIALDLPGHGASEVDGDYLTLDNCLADIRFTLDYAKENFKDAKISLFATSFGAYLTLLLLTRYGNEYNKVVLRCPAIRMDKIFEDEILVGTMDEISAFVVCVECVALAIDRQALFTHQDSDTDAPGLDQLHLEGGAEQVAGVSVAQGAGVSYAGCIGVTQVSILATQLGDSVLQGLHALQNCLFALGYIGIAQQFISYIGQGLNLNAGVVSAVSSFEVSNPVDILAQVVGEQTIVEVEGQGGSILNGDVAICLGVLHSIGVSHQLFSGGAFELVAQDCVSTVVGELSNRNQVCFGVLSELHISTQCPGLDQVDAVGCANQDGVGLFGSSLGQLVQGEVAGISAAI